MEAEHLKVNQYKLFQFLESEHTISCTESESTTCYMVPGQGMSVTLADSLEQKHTLNYMSWGNIVYKSGLKHTHQKNK